MKNRRYRYQKPKTLDHESTFINFMKWMKANGYRKTKCLRPALFPNTDRGIMAGEKIERQDCLIRIPLNLLITTTTVMQSRLGEYLKKFGSQIRYCPQQILALFLALEKRNCNISFWKPYLDILPSKYTIPFYWEVIPPSNVIYDLQKLISNQKKDVTEAYESLEPLLKFLEFNLISKITFDEFCWGWFTVHTRGVHYEQPSNPLFAHGERDHYALAPFLDFFNHSPNSKMKAVVNNKSQYYEITTLDAFDKYNEVFINYGPHDNLKLVMDYGFTVRINPHSYISFSLDEIIAAVQEHQTIQDFKTKINILKTHDLLKLVHCDLNGASWNFITVVQILMFPSQELNNWFYYLQDCASSLTEEIKNIIKLCIQRKLDLVQSSKVQQEKGDVSIEKRLAYSLEDEHSFILEKTLSSL